MRKKTRSEIKTVVILTFMIIIIPGFSCMIYHMINPDFSIGKGGSCVENHYMGKNVMIEVSGLYKNIDVEEYVTGIMAGVISPEYNIEALKTQAVLIRTNVLKEMEEKGSNDDYDMSYEYLTKEDRKTLWGNKRYDKYEAVIEKAVTATAGKVLRDEGNLIMAMYHEVSIGKTASASEILDEDISYLQSVDSSSDVEAKNYMNIYEFSYEDIRGLQEDYFEKNGLTAQNTVETTEGDTDSKQVSDVEDEDIENKQVGEKLTADKIVLEVTEVTDNGFVKKATLGNDTYSGEEIREMLGLASVNFYIENVEAGVRIVCLGKGSCLGVSQYGANHMADKGSTMEEIIKYYYKDVSIEDYKN